MKKFYPRALFLSCVPARLFLIGGLCLASCICVRAQYVAINDTNFLNKLITLGYNPCLNGNLLDTTCNKVLTDTVLLLTNAFSTSDSLKITDLTAVQYFKSLRRLHCNYNLVTTLPSLSDSLRFLYCDYNSITSLPQLPPSLSVLQCMYNQLTSLTTLPSSLRSLWCDSNQLTSLPPLPNSIVLLSCNMNQLTSLPTLPDSLQYLSCWYNQLIAVPQLPNSLTAFLCYHNQISNIPELPDSLFSFYCNNNPDLFCLPQLKKIKDFSFYNTGISCLPNYPQSNTTSIPALSSVAICDLFNNNGCEVYSYICGRTFIDSITNCVNDVYEYGLPNFKLQLYNSGILEEEVYAGAEGFYSFDVDSFTTYDYSVDSSNIPFSVSCPASGFRTSNITTLDSLDFSMDFALNCKNGFDIGATACVRDSGIFRPANFAVVNISAGDVSNFYNAHCATGVSGTVQVVINGSATYAGVPAGALAPSSVIGNTLTYNIADFGSISYFNTFRIRIQTDSSAQGGQTICFTVTVTPSAGDYNASNNTLSRCFVVVNSYDPNVKEVYPINDIDASQDWLTYTIHFQNTGTAEAQHIYIDDTLDANLDVSSFQLLAYSHQPLVQIYNDTRKVRFNFPNINLPDSNTNEPQSHGYVQYKVKLKDNLPIGTQIQNTAYIVFDFNAPVVTNTTLNTITTSTGVSPLSFGEGQGVRIFPNPARDEFNIIIPENLLGSTLTLTDVTGRIIAEKKLQTENSKLKTENVASGVYFVRIKSEVKKLILH